MINAEFQAINTERLFLRRLQATDWEVISFLRSDKEVNKFVKRPSAETREEAFEFISKINKGIVEKKLFYWAIEHKKTNNAIGTICLWNFSQGGKSAEVGFDLSPQFQGRGMMSESLKSIIDFGFNKLQLCSMVAYTNKENQSSKRLLERKGFKLATDKKDDDNQDNLVYELRG
jgi:ribosomal-protein-alanine N-acetyltransferase